MKHIYIQTMKTTLLSYKDFGKMKTFYALKFKLLQLRNVFISIENTCIMFLHDNLDGTDLYTKNYKDRRFLRTSKYFSMGHNK